MANTIERPEERDWLHIHMHIICLGEFIEYNAFIHNIDAKPNTFRQQMQVPVAAGLYISDF
ncbi:MAG: hypothetical protein EA396_08760 [Anaerolineaceae bacterium]|nr:MAG: hypothetical protein EA396_08760 [Anaerolineaceae bacterium]